MSSGILLPHFAHGSLLGDGFRIRHWIVAARESDTFHPTVMVDTLAVVINLSGSHVLTHDGKETAVLGEQAAILRADPELVWSVRAHARQKWVVVEFADGLLTKLRPGLQFVDAAVDPAKRLAPRAFPATSELLTLAQQLTEPPAYAACLPVWFHAKVVELAALTLFAPPPARPDTLEEMNRRKVERALLLLERDLHNPPTLEMLAEAVECGPFYLSRLFATLVGQSIPEVIRQRRVQWAARLLTSGRDSVSEIALRVGYESFGAFTRAFTREMGVTPSAYRNGSRKKPDGG